MGLYGGVGIRITARDAVPKNSSAKWKNAFAQNTRQLSHTAWEDKSTFAIVHFGWSLKLYREWQVFNNNLIDKTI